jgi:allantoinase
MPLPDTYLSYPHRTRGNDQDRYDWTARNARTPMSLPGGAAVAALIVVPLEYHRLNPATKPFAAPGAMVTPYPDLRHYTTRDYGNRIGAFRLLAELKAAKLKATFAVNAALLSRVRPLIDAIVADGHEIAAHGFAADAIHWSGLDESAETDLIARTLEGFRHAGFEPRVWMSPARQQSFRTLDLIARAGLRICLDWESDSVPLRMRTRYGELIAVPLANELDDRLLLIGRHQTEEEWSTQIGDALEMLRAEAPRAGGQVLSFSLTPYISGQPFRIREVRRVLQRLAEDPALWTATASQIAAYAPPARAGSSSTL